MQQEIIFIISVIVLFLLTGLFGGIGIWSMLYQKKKRAIWSFAIGFVFIVVYLIVMFSVGII
ncbi:hypothetical protein [Halalkalibacter akibai]|uniref:Uncharacterized protein n=1 Tax=Halalkalibacter akibai (strain ATCC 43226 / DSM 21942 / CIP 109018 / JCM 9157 / 1139) TaxID=1236973 RepID=W4QSN1_HALA3|nr:hypothetical protein [Halalkalibacter akibai]GAE34638.1 hypothetical protein JCM9157_1708 [Halalkalibacter akibai JCM 9157]